MKNIHIRFEDDVLFPCHSSGLIWDSLVIRPSDKFWEFQWPTEENPNELSLGPINHRNMGSDGGSGVDFGSGIDVDVGSGVGSKGSTDGQSEFDRVGSSGVRDKGGTE